MTDAVRLPLAGRTVAVTRPRAQAASLAEPLEALGARVLLTPTIRIVPRAVDDQIVSLVTGDLTDYQLLVFTSANAVDIFLDYLVELRMPLETLAATTVAAVGPATASALDVRGVRCDVVPDDAMAEGLLQALGERAVASSGARVLIPRARVARDLLPDALRAGGARVDVLPVYDTVPVERLEAPPAEVEAADFITFTSGSTVRRFVALMAPSGAGRPLAERLRGARLCSIGPVTSDVLREQGLPVAVEAAEFTSAGLVAAIAAAAAALA
jgi:uroporphyrinogen III methyltransferase / synthase